MIKDLPPPTANSNDDHHLPQVKQHTILQKVGANEDNLSAARAFQLSVSKNIPTNITSSLAVSQNYKNFASITRQLSTNSSQWIYRLDLYDFNSYKKLQTIDIYQSYNTDKHFLTFIPTASQQAFIAVANVNNIIFYRSSPLQRVNKVLHHQANMYDLTASPDGQLVVLVGQTIVMYRTTGFKNVIFPQIVQNARFCDFSRDGKYMVIASTSSINIYVYTRINDNYQFQSVPLTNFQSPINYESITSVEFNPNNATELIVGFLSSSPSFFSIENGGQFYKKFVDIQPMSSKNAKIARYMPDSVRYYSFDYLNGVGLWPGVGNRLYYKQNFLLYDANSNNLGTKLIGYVWQQIKVTDILLDCGQGASVSSCKCVSNQVWSYQTYSCVNLSCFQAEYATGAVINNECGCVNGFIWDPIVRKCAIDCNAIPNALTIRPSLYQCYCDNNWNWNAATRRCEFDCTVIPFSSGLPNLSVSNECICLPGFIWNKSNNQCQCPQYMKPSGSICLCYPDYYLNQQGLCLANCSMIGNAVGPNSDPQRCECQTGYYYTSRDDMAGCQLNCSGIKDTIQQYDFNKCLCHEHMDWLNNTCVVNCKDIQFSDSVGLQNNTCACAINYNWQDKIKQCARNCIGVKYVDPKGQPTLQACPCINYFLWNQPNTRCQIQCSLIPNSEVYTLSQINQCQCRSGFVWNSSTYSCQVDCEKIWNAKSRINDSSCNCVDNQQFNSTSLTCASAGTAGLFSSPLSIAGFVIGIVVAIVILAILIRFCWGFKTPKEDYQQKKIKAKDPGKKNKLLRQQKAPPILQEQLKTNERLKSPVKMQTATSI